MISNLMSKSLAKDNQVWAQMSKVLIERGQFQMT